MGDKDVVTREATGSPQLYRDLPTLEQAFRAATERTNFLAPVVAIDQIPEMHSMSLRIVHLDPTPSDAKGRGGGGDVYLQGGGDGDGDDDDKKKDAGGLALTKVALDKIAAAAGISWDAVLSGRLDDRSEPYYCLYRAVGVIQDFDGSRRQISSEREIDLRKGSPVIAGWSEKRLKMAREHIHAMAESKAKNRAIRQALAIKSKYTAEELEKPFVVPRLVFDLERVTDPAVKAAIAMRIADRAMGVVSELYGTPQPATAALPAPVVTSAPQGAEMGGRKPPPLPAEEKKPEPEAKKDEAAKDPKKGFGF